MTRKFIDSYYNLSEDTVQELVRKAQDNDYKAQLKLLDIFSNFIQKYVTLLYYGKYTLKGTAGYDNRRFLALFVKDRSIRYFLLRDKLNAGGQKELNEIVRGINYMVTRYGDEEDVKQTVVLAFLESLNIYSPRESKDGLIPFSAFLYSYFYYKLKKQVDSLLIDQLGRKTFPLISDEEANTDEWSSEEPIQGYTAPPVEAAEELIQCEEIDEEWVLGETATGPFKDLTIQERQILKWRYVDQEKFSEIALKVTAHPNGLRESVAKIREKIAYYIQEDLKL